MSTAYSEFTVRIPKGKETSLFRNLAQRMGWQTTAHRAKKSETIGTDTPNATTIKAMEDARAGRTFKASSVADLLAQLDA